MKRQRKTSTKRKVAKKKVVRKVAKKTAKKKVVRKVAKKSAKKTAKKSITKRKKMTVKEYAKKEDIDFERTFSDVDPNMPMQTYLKSLGLPNTAKVFKMVYNE